MQQWYARSLPFFLAYPFFRSEVISSYALRNENTSSHCRNRPRRRYSINILLPIVLMSAYSAAAVVSAKKKTYFELFCVPIFPMNSKHVWVCSICQWRVPLQQGYVYALFPVLI